MRYITEHESPGLNRGGKEYTMQHIKHYLINELKNEPVFERITVIA